MSPGIEHHFVAGIRAQTDVQYRLAGPKDQWNDLPFVQGTIDALCGLLSFCMAAAILTGVARHRFERVASATRGPLRELWARASTTAFEGTEHQDIESFAQILGLDCETVLSASAPRIGRAAATAIRGGHVPIVRFDSAAFSHFSPVIGVELVAGKSVPRALLLLDPGEPSQWCVPFNARLELSGKGGASARARRPYPLPLRYLSGAAYGVRLRSLVVVRARPP